MQSQLQALPLWLLKFPCLSKCYSNNYASYANYPLIEYMITTPLCQFWCLQKGLERCSPRNKWLLSTLSFTRTKSFPCSSQTDSKKAHSSLVWILWVQGWGSTEQCSWELLSSFHPPIEVTSVSNCSVRREVLTAQSCLLSTIIICSNILSYCRY